MRRAVCWPSPGAGSTRTARGTEAELQVPGGRAGFRHHVDQVEDDAHRLHGGQSATDEVEEQFVLRAGRSLSLDLLDGVHDAVEPNEAHDVARDAAWQGDHEVVRPLLQRHVPRQEGEVRLVRLPVGRRRSLPRPGRAAVRCGVAESAAAADVASRPVEATVSASSTTAQFSTATRQAVLTALDVLGYERPIRLRGRPAWSDWWCRELENPIFPAFQVMETLLAGLGLYAGAVHPDFRHHRG